MIDWLIDKLCYLIEVGADLLTAFVVMVVVGALGLGFWLVVRWLVL